MTANDEALRLDGSPLEIGIDLDAASAEGAPHPPRMPTATLVDGPRFGAYLVGPRSRRRTTRSTRRPAAIAYVPRAPRRTPSAPSWRPWRRSRPSGRDRRGSLRARRAVPGPTRAPARPAGRGARRGARRRAHPGRPLAGGVLAADASPSRNRPTMVHQLLAIATSKWQAGVLRKVRSRPSPGSEGCRSTMVRAPCVAALDVRATNSRSGHDDPPARRGVRSESSSAGSSPPRGASRQTVSVRGGRILRDDARLGRSSSAAC